MASGKVKWWNEKKGFGFIAQESGQDVFVHHTSILGGGFKNLTEGEEVLFARDHAGVPGRDREVEPASQRLCRRHR